MKKLVGLGLIIAALTSPVFAADLPTKAPVYKAPVAVVSWTGFYVGAQAGYGWENDPTYNYSSSSMMMVMVDPSVSFGMRGFVGGATAGYNWQTGPWVLGVEGDISYADVNGSVLTASTAPCFIQGCTARLSWFGTGRVRAGYAAGDWLPYITGGAAVGEIKGSAPAVLPPFAASTRRVGAGPWVADWNIDFTRTGRRRLNIFI